MSFKFEIDASEQVIRETWDGTVDMQQLKDSCQQEWTHPDYHKHLHMISDFRNARVTLTSGEMWTFIRWFGQRESLGRLAMVVGREMSFGIARMFASISEANPKYADSVRIFYDLDAANAWIAETNAAPAKAIV